ncbi:unnamed protein product [Phytomonas sp. Hart1]|nr:unnamed protein product [Phytomonas sp. Hart1]|eukprot:CCW69360.1 unnamed protein product [Phytomonas sp. isolate Hart1]
MGGLVRHFPPAITLEWIEILRMGLNYAATTLESPNSVDWSNFEAALYHCLLDSLRASEECGEYLFDAPPVVDAVVGLLRRRESPADELTAILVEITAYFPPDANEEVVNLARRLARRVFQLDDNIPTVNWALLGALTSFLQRRLHLLTIPDAVDCLLEVFFPAEWAASPESSREPRRLLDLHARIIRQAGENQNQIALELIRRCREVIFEYFKLPSEERGVLAAALRPLAGGLRGWMWETSAARTLDVREALFLLLDDLAKGVMGTLAEARTLLGFFIASLECFLRTPPGLSAEFFDRVVGVADRFLTANPAAADRHRRNFNEAPTGEKNEIEKKAEEAENNGEIHLEESLTDLWNSLYWACKAGFVDGGAGEGLRGFLVQHALRDVEMNSCREFLGVVLQSQAVRSFLRTQDEDGYRKVLNRLANDSDFAQLQPEMIQKYIQES